MPILSVIMPAFNAAQRIAAAIKSILQQSFDDFEFIIINDGSADATATIINNYAQKDPHIKPIHLPTNQGIAYALNVGLKQSQGAYIARMDADDLSHPLRLEKQYNYLLQHDYVDICGAAMQNVKLSAKQIRDKTKTTYYPVTDAAIKMNLFFIYPLGKTFAHATLLSRRKVFEHVAYSEQQLYMEDADIYLKWARHIFIFANLPEILYTRYLRQDSICGRHADIQLSNHVKLLIDWISDTDLLSSWELNSYKSILLGRPVDETTAASIFDKLLQVAKHYFGNNLFEQFALEKNRLWDLYCQMAYKKYRIARL